MKKRNITQKIFRVVFWIIFVLLFLFVALYLFATLGRPYFGEETVFMNSSEYQSSHQPVTRLVTIRRSGMVRTRFFFYPNIFAAWVDKTRPYVFLVTSDTGSIKGAHGLYVYDGTKIKKVYQARTVEFAKGEKSPARLYASYIIPPYSKEDYEKKLGEKKSLMHRAFTLSPDGRYLFGYESGYEGGTGFTIDLTTLEKISPTIEAPGEMVWNADYTCAVGPAYAYGDEQWVQLTYYDQNELRVRSYDNHFWASDVVDVAWRDGCSGIVTIDTGDYDRTGMTIGRHKEYYRFSKDNEKLIRVASYNKSAYDEGKPSPQILENIFFTIETPKLPSK